MCLQGDSYSEGNERKYRTSLPGPSTSANFLFVGKKLQNLRSWTTSPWTVWSWSSMTWTRWSSENINWRAAWWRRSTSTWGSWCRTRDSWTRYPRAARKKPTFEHQFGSSWSSGVSVKKSFFSGCGEVNCSRSSLGLGSAFGSLKTCCLWAGIKGPPETRRNQRLMQTLHQTRTSLITLFKMD